jgi:hypothetical protein
MTEPAIRPAKPTYFELVHALQTANIALGKLAPAGKWTLWKIPIIGPMYVRFLHPQEHKDCMQYIWLVREALKRAKESGAL